MGEAIYVLEILKSYLSTNPFRLKVIGRVVIATGEGFKVTVHSQSAQGRRSGG